MPLQLERINAYAKAVIRTLQTDGHQRGGLMEERVLKGDRRMNRSAAFTPLPLPHTEHVGVNQNAPAALCVEAT